MSGARNRKRGSLLTKLRPKRPKGEDDERDLKPAESRRSKSQRFTVALQIRSTILNPWINILLVMVPVPVGIALHFISSVSRVAVFVVNFIDWEHAIESVIRHGNVLFLGWDKDLCLTSPN